MKTFLWTFVAVFAGIFVFSRWVTRGNAAVMGGANSYGRYAGPEIDPLTGAYNPIGSGAGTVNTTAGGLSPGDTMSGGDFVYGKL